MKVSHNIIKIDDIRYIQIPELFELGLNHLFTTKDMNMRVENDDNQEVTENIQKIYKALDIYPEQLYFMEQSHSDWVSIVDEPALGRDYDFGHCNIGLDGLITSQRTYALASSEADCVPIILYDPVKKVQANLHSGWKGTFSRIARRAISHMKTAYETNPADLIVGIGPHISADSYEVQHDVSDLFFGSFLAADQIIHFDEGKMTLDLSKAIEITLLQAGVLLDNIYTTGLDTFAEKDLLHSYRRDKEESNLSFCVTTMLQPGEYFEPEEE